MTGPDRNKWKKAMDEEMDGMKANSTLELVKLPPGTSAIGCKWVYKIKYNNEGKECRYKARLVAKGYTQKKGIDYNEVFAPVVRQTPFRILLTIAGHKDWIVRHYDVKNAFLNGELSDMIYMKQPEGYEVKGQKDLALRLNKSIYGLKHAANVWNKSLDNLLKSCGFQQSKVDLCLYTKILKETYVYIIVYVDDIIIATNKEEQISEMEQELQRCYNMTNLGDISNYLGVEVNRDRNGLFYINQERYIKYNLDKYGLPDAKTSRIPLDTGYSGIESERKLPSKEEYQSLIGALMYISVFTKPDISASVAILSKKIKDPTYEDWTEAKRTLRYLKGTINYQLKLGNEDTKENNLVGYSDADWAGCKLDRKSNTGYIFLYNGSPLAGEVENNLVSRFRQRRPNIWRWQKLVRKDYGYAIY